jgi:sialate O-acetylesterase
MVLQRDIMIKIWGWASPGEKVKISMNEIKVNTVTGPDQKWMVSAAMKAGGRFHDNHSGEK